VLDYCGLGCTQAFLYNAGTLVDSVGNTIISSPEMLVMDLGAGQMVDSIAISSCEGVVLGTSITIYSMTVDGESGTWGTVKALHR
jgi:hypothetical protein